MIGERSLWGFLSLFFLQDFVAPCGNPSVRFRLTSSRVPACLGPVDEARSTRPDERGPVDEARSTRPGLRERGDGPNRIRPQDFPGMGRARERSCLCCLIRRQGVRQEARQGDLAGSVLAVSFAFR
jgi:hypothetical protein